MNRETIMKLPDAVKTFLEAIDDGTISIDTRSPTTKRHVRTLRESLSNAYLIALPKPPVKMPDFTAKEASTLRKDLIIMRNTALDKNEADRALTLSSAIAFICSAVKTVWGIDLKDER